MAPAEVAFAPTWGLMLVVLLLTFGAGLGVSVFLAGRHLEIGRHHILSFFQSLLWVVPALVVVVLIGQYSASNRDVNPTSSIEPAASASVDPPNLIRSRTTSSEVPTWARPEEGSAEKKGVIARFTSGFVRRIKGSPDTGDWLVFSSGPFVTEQEASQELTPRIQTALENQLEADFPLANRGLAVNYSIPVSLIEQHAVRDSVLESFTKDFDLGRGPEPMVRLHAAVEVTPQFREAVYRDWKGQIVHARLVQYGKGVGITTAFLGLIAAYLSLNSATQNRYPWRLRLAALSAAAAVVIAGLVIPF